jgi:NADH dehydrogenase (ubiquinone) flavoprotein 2
MFAIVKNFAVKLAFKNTFKFSAGYFSHRETQDNNNATPFDFTEENYKEVYKLLNKYPSNWKRSAIIPLLHLAQKQNDNFLSLNAMKTVAKIC